MTQRIKIRFSPEYADWSHARALLRKYKKINYLYDYAFPVTLFCSALGGVLVNRPNTLGPVLLGLLAGLFLSFFPYIFNRLSWRNSWRKAPNHFVQIDADAVTLLYEDQKGSGTSTVPWSAIQAFDEDSQVFFLLARGSMLFLPKRDIPAESILTIRDLALSKVPAHVN